MQVVLRMGLLQGVIAHSCRLYELLGAADDAVLLQAADNLFELAAVEGM
jgi:hypothetical protein